MAPYILAYYNNQWMSTLYTQNTHALKESRGQQTLESKLTLGLQTLN